MKIKKFALTFLVVGFALSNIAILYSLYNSSLAPGSSSAASDGRILLSLVSPASLSVAANNSTVSIGLSAQNTTDASTAEIILNYDPTVLQGVQMVEDSSLVLALNKKFDATAGKATIDIAYIGGGNMPSDTKLVTFDFKVLNNSNNTSKVSVANGSTMGIPNKIAANGYGILAMNFGTTQAQNPPPVVNPTNPTNPVNPTNPTNPSVNPVPPTSGGDGEVVIPEEEQPVQVDEETVAEDTDNGVTTNQTQSVTYQSPNQFSSSNNRTTLTILLFITIGGTVASLFFLIKELIIKKETHNANPFM